MGNERIKLEDTMMDIMVKMSDGNPGAIKVLMEMIGPNNIDPDNVLGGTGVILFLDTLGIYGTDIYVLYSDICNRSLVSMLAVLRATQMGLFDGSVLKDACSRQDYSGREMVPVEELYTKVQENLPNFDVKSEE